MEKNYTYEILENGYYIFINGEKVIHQYEPYIPDRSKSYEENAKAQIKELQEMDKHTKEEYSTEERISALEDAVNSMLGF